MSPDTNPSGTRRVRIDRASDRESTRPGSSKTTKPARILLVNQYYWPDQASTAQHLTDLAESLVEEGHEVHVLCGRGAYRPGLPAPPRWETRNGVHIHRVAASSLGRRSTLTRLADYLSFFISAIFKGLALPRFDAVVTLTTPPLIGILGLLLQLLKRSRHVIWSMDLHPDASFALGHIAARSPLARLLDYITKTVYRTADRVVVLGPYMADRVCSKGVGTGRLVSIPVWSRRDEIEPVPRSRNRLRQELGLEGKFIAMYSGNLGLAHEFQTFLATARSLRHREDIVFLFVGGGPRLAEVQDVQQRDSLPNLRFLELFPRDRLSDSLSLADVHLISLRPEMVGIVVPSKLYGAMASARPVLFVGPDHCESADTIRSANCGYVCRGGDSQSLAGMIESLAADPALAGELGAEGRA